ncbi:MAG: hypothetical protein OCC49_20070 [Fibrobacterales bacterium]
MLSILNKILAEKVFTTNAWVYFLVLMLLPLANKYLAQHIPIYLMYKVSDSSYLNPISFIVTEFVGLIRYIWIWYVMSVLSKSIKDALVVKSNVFKLILICALISDLCMSEFVEYFIGGFIQKDTIWWVFVISVLVISWITAKQLRTFELSKLSSIKETMQLFVAILFLPLGVFWLQPKLKTYWNTLIKNKYNNSLERHHK